MDSQGLSYGFYWIETSGVADSILSLSRTGSSGSHTGIRYREAPAKRAIDHLSHQDCRVPASNLVGEEGGEWGNQGPSIHGKIRGWLENGGNKNRILHRASQPRSCIVTIVNNSQPLPWSTSSIQHDLSKVPSISFYVRYQWMTICAVPINVLGNATVDYSLVLQISCETALRTDFGFKRPFRRHLEYYSRDSEGVGH